MGGDNKILPMAINMLDSIKRVDRMARGNTNGLKMDFTRELSARACEKGVENGWAEIAHTRVTIYLF